MNTLAVPLAGAPQPASPPLTERFAALADALLPAAAALLITVLLFSAAVALAGFDPLEVWSLIVQGGFGDAFAWQNTLQRAAPLMLTGLAVALPAQAGRVIIGAEGALVLGGLAAAALGTVLAPQAPPLVVWPLMALAGMLIGGLWIGIVGWLREKREVNETIASLLMSFIAIALFNQCGRDRAARSGQPEQAFDQAAARRLHAAVRCRGWTCTGAWAWASSSRSIAWAVVKLTPLGLSLRVAGGNPRTALGVGLPVAWLTIGACAAGGACAGLAGAVEVAAVHGAANASLIAGYGYSGILIAFAARFSPAGVVPVAILVGGIAASGSLLQRRLGLPDASVTVLLGFAFVALIGCETLRGRSFFRKG